MNTGAFGENFPYSNFHDLNMDWIIKIAKDFLDQYTHIQEIIENGETDLQNLINQGLSDLDDKAEALENALQQWYDSHSEDIAEQLQSALDDLSTALGTAITNFNTRAEQKATETIATIPDDYTELFNTVIDLQRILDMRNIGTVADGFVSFADGTIHTGSGTYRYSTPIKVEPGQKYRYKLTGSTSVLTIACYTNNDTTNAVIASSLRGTNASDTGVFEIPQSIGYVRITFENTQTALFYRDFEYLEETLQIRNIGNFHDGFIRSSTGEIVEGSGSYVYSDMLPVFTNQKFKFQLLGSSSVLLIACYENRTDTTPKIDRSVIGLTVGTDPVKGVFNVPVGINYIRICTVRSYEDAIFEINTPTNIGEITNFVFELNNLALNREIVFNTWLRGNDIGYGVGFFSVKHIPVTPNTRYSVYCDGSYNAGSSYYDARFITSFDSNDNVISYEQYVRGYYTTPANASYVNITYFYKTSATSDNEIGDTGLYYFSNSKNYEGSYQSIIGENYKSLQNKEVFFERQRKGTICFSFDDGVENDSLVADIFDKHGAKCGFALITGAIEQDPRAIWYRELNNRGFTIMSHSNNGDTMNGTIEYTSEQLTQKIRNTKIDLLHDGFTIEGWVTPSSYMETSYVEDYVKKYYDYGYTRYFGPYDGTTGTPYNTLTDTPYYLKRVHLNTTTLENLKTAVDLTIANNGLLSIYAHAYEDPFDYDKLEQIIEYIKGKENILECHLYAPDEAIKYYFRSRD